MNNNAKVRVASTTRRGMSMGLEVIAAVCAFTATTSAQVDPPHWDNTIGVPGPDGTVHALAVYNGDLIVGGVFATAGGQTVNGIARWDGSSWHPLTSGGQIGVGIPSPGVPSVLALTVYNGELIAGGNFMTAGGQSASFIAKWNGSQWSPLGSGTNTAVRALTVFGSNLYAGGSFAFAGGQQVNFIARWNGSQWSSLGLGMNSTVYALTVFNDGTGSALFAGGGFTSAGGGQGGGGVSANFIAKWNGSQWSALGSGMGGVEFPGVLALTGFDDGTGPALYAGGEFTIAGGQPANFIAKWNGTQWSSVGAGLSPFVRALTVFNDGSGSALYAGGFFVSAGGETFNRVARWNGSQWSPVGSGLSNGVRAFAQFDDGTGTALFMGGEFTNAGGLPANHITAWRSGNVQQPEYDVLNIPPGVKNVVFITHGWNTDDKTWNEFWLELESDVQSFINHHMPNPAEWWVYAHEWDGCTFLQGPECAKDNAFAEGPPVGENLALAQLEHIHFIAHSAGSMLISRAAERIRQIQGWGGEAPVIHSSFLDPYTGYTAWPYSSFYGANSSWSDNYISYDSLHPWTYRDLDNAHNVDVTRVDPEWNPDGLWSSHPWPRIFYHETVTDDLECQLPETYGWPLSLVGCYADPGCASWTVPSQHSNYPQGEDPLDLTCAGALLGSSAGPPNPADRFDDPIDFDAVQTSTSPGGVEITEDGFDIAVAPGEGWGSDGSAAWIDVLIDLPIEVNSIVFETEFMSPANAEGLLTVYAHSKALTSDERFEASGTQVFAFDLPQEAGPGLTHFGFRLDAFGSGVSAVSVKNVQTAWGGAEPTGFALLSPADGAAVQNLGFALEWQESDWAYGYDLRVAHDPGLLDVVLDVTGLTETSYEIAVGVLENNVTYYWGVTARNPAAETSSSPSAAALTVLTPGDLNADETINVSDLLLLLGMWGPCVDPDDCPADLDGDDLVEVSDLLILLANWG